MKDRKVIDSVVVFDHGLSDRTYNPKDGEAVLFDFACENCGHKPLIIRGLYTEDKMFSLQWNCLNCRHVEYQGAVDFIYSLQADHLLKKQKRKSRLERANARTE